MYGNKLPTALLGCAAIAALQGCAAAPSHTRHDTYPMPVSVPTDYTAASRTQTHDRIHPQDLLEISVFKVPELSKTVRVDDNGNIALPLVGTIHAAGINANTLERTIAARLGKDYMHNPQVNVFVKESTRNRVTVAGSVRQSGIFPTAGETTLLQAIALAGGLDKLADHNSVFLFRKQGNRVQRYRVNIDAISRGLAADPLLMPDDRVVVLDSQGKVLLDNLRGLISPINVL